jgi:hypothetical protein
MKANEVVKFACLCRKCFCKGCWEVWIVWIRNLWFVSLNVLCPNFKGFFFNPSTSVTPLSAVLNKKECWQICRCFLRPELASCVAGGGARCVTAITLLPQKGDQPLPEQRVEAHLTPNLSQIEHNLTAQPPWRHCNSIRMAAARRRVLPCKLIGLGLDQPFPTFYLCYPKVGHSMWPATLPWKRQ